jgi:hypothetical protein
MQASQGCAFLADDEQARCLSIQAVSKFKKTGRRTRLAKLLDHTKAHSATAMHRHPGRFVDDDQGIVLEHRRKLTPWNWRVIQFLCHPYRRHTHLIADCQAPIMAAHPLFTTLATAQNAVSCFLGTPFSRFNKNCRYAARRHLRQPQDMAFFTQLFHSQYNGQALPSLDGVPGDTKRFRGALRRRCRLSAFQIVFSRNRFAGMGRARRSLTR